ncbi:MAG: ribosome assembly RNA-binding protein YhbY [Clostridia bacterium]|nr:ribosome assembly RNA-binding protein YhbY [Clostridia bacterium]
MLTSKQRSQLKAMATELQPIFQIGKGGINDNMCVQLDDTLEARELIKIKTLETSPVSAREAADQLSERLGADIVIVIGTKIVLYRESKDNKKIILVK